MPGETEIAAEFGCARSTVNRALRGLAEEGLIERKRRAGTRILELPVRRAHFDLSLIRQEVESMGSTYLPQVVLREIVPAPKHIAERLKLEPSEPLLHLETVHLASGHPHAFEDRWVNIDAAPGILDAPLDKISVNEWLIREVPYSSGDVIFAAQNAGPREAKALNTLPGDALFTIDRATWFNDVYITAVKLFYPPGHELRTTL
jgi:GntR family histidine utilization transcriptional repressor